MTASIPNPTTAFAAATDMQWILDDLMQSEMMLMGLYIDSTEEDLLSIYSQYPLELLEDLLLKMAFQERYTCCDAIRQIIIERSLAGLKQLN